MTSALSGSASFCKVPDADREIGDATIVDDDDMPSCQILNRIEDLFTRAISGSDFDARTLSITTLSITIISIMALIVQNALKM